MKIGSGEGGEKVGWRRSENMKSCQYKSLFVSFLRIVGVRCVQVSADDQTVQTNACLTRTNIPVAG